MTEPTTEPIPFKPMTALQYLVSLHQVCFFQTKEGDLVGPASKSELKRWIQNNGLHINGFKTTIDELIDYPVHSIVMFPTNAKRRCTLL